MAEPLEIDQSHLPRVQEVCQNFAVLEDGVLAHSLQEQEIEHYYTNNIQKNQLVQNDIRVAKRLQDEEEEQRQNRALLRQESRQLEEQDFEYAREIQEEIQRCAEEARRRELDDEELAKQIQEEEEQRLRRIREERDRTSLELGELQQVLQDEELARKLQEEEEKTSSRNPPLTSPRKSYPDGDFRVAQVAQDEEIARYIQKQEIKSKRRSRELEGPVSWREHRAMMSQHDRRTRDRQVPRERLDSEGLPSPTEDCSPEDQPHSPVSTLPTPHSIRNIAEELDPTFQARRPGTDSLRAAQTVSTCAPLPAPQSGLLEEPTFIPPTKRQADKSVRPKSKEKRENCKQQ